MNGNMRIAHFGTDTITNLGPKSRKLVLGEIKNPSKIKIWTTDNYLCRLCKRFVKELVFLKSQNP